MNAKLIILGVTAMLPVALWGQSPVDAYNLSQTELRGTARFMSMAGAFTALGGDLSTLNQNPAGIGVYRGSDVGLTLDLNMMSSKSSGIPAGSSWNRTHFDVNNFGYVGTFNLNDQVMQTFSWGISYGRQKSFERQFRGGGVALQSSLSNYIALMTDGISPYDMNFDKDKNYNPYFNSDINWLSILAYSGGLINPIPGETEMPDGTYEPVLTDTYNGLFQQPVYDDKGNLIIAPTTGTADFLVRERGYVDEYSINFGGNLANTVYWGLGIGITDMNFEQQANYIETLKGANVPASSNPMDGIVEGNCDYELANWKKISGTGVNLKFGLIFKPINEFRLGIAVHTPTWYSLNTLYNASVDFGADNGVKASDYTETADYSWNLRSPWRLMIGAAGVIGGRGIISVDYEYQAYNAMKTSDSYGDFTDFNDYIKSDYKASNTIRVGGEFRVTPQFSLRAGYAFTSTNVNNDIKDNKMEVVTTGCNPAYSLNNNTSYVTAGLGYRTGGFYADLAYVHRHMESAYHCFSPFEDYDGLWTLAPQATITDNSSQLVLTLGYKF